MNRLLRGVGPALTFLCVLVVTVWAGLLIVAPQLTLLDRALTAPKPVQDSTHPPAGEAQVPGLTIRYFAALILPERVAMASETRDLEETHLLNRFYTLVGSRFARDGETYQRSTLVTLIRKLASAILATVLALCACYPIACKLALATPSRWARWLFLLLIIPCVLLEPIRIHAWTRFIDEAGQLNQGLFWLGPIAEPIRFRSFSGTIFFVVLYTHMFFMLLPLFCVMTTLDRNQIEAAQDLGAGSLRLPARIVIPHAKPGIILGCIVTFMLAAGAFSVPHMFGRGLPSEWAGVTIHNHVFASQAVETGAALSLVYTLVCFLVVALFMWLTRTRFKDFARVSS